MRSKGLKTGTALVCLLMSVILAGIAAIGADGMPRVSVQKGYVSVSTAEGTRNYRRYAQKTSSDYYLYSRGCTTTAVAIAASGFGKKFTPEQIVKAGSSVKWGELYAVRKNKQSARYHHQLPISVFTASSILRNMGIKTKAVYRFKKKEAEKQIRAHLLEGKPVILVCSNRRHNGVQIANGFHAVVLVGFNRKGKAVFIDTFTGKVNYAHGSGKTANLSLSALLKYHVNASSGNVRSPYVVNRNAAWGYILVG